MFKELQQALVGCSLQYALMCVPVQMGVRQLQVVEELVIPGIQPATEFSVLSGR